MKGNGAPPETAIQEEAARLEARFARNLALFQHLAPSQARRHAGWTPRRLRLQWVPGHGATLVGRESGRPVDSAPPEERARRQVDEFLADPTVLGSRFETKASPYEETSLHPKHMNRAVRALHDADEDVPRSRPESIHLLLVLGLGLGHHLKELLERVEVNHLCVVEPDEDVMHAAMHTVEWLDYLETFSAPGRSLELIAGLDAAGSVERILSWAEELGEFHFVEAHLLVHARTPVLDEVEQGVRNVVIPRLKGLLGFFDDERIGLAHSEANLRAGHPLLIRPDRPPAAEADPAPPVFVVGNGPSLDRGAEAIRRHRERALVVSCGTALGSLAQAGIRPDIHVEMERTRPVVEWISEATSPEDRAGILLLAFNTTHPQVLELFSDRGLLLKPNDLGASWIEARVRDGGALPRLQDGNPTVGNLGLALAAALGARDIYLFGLDLGFPGDAQHHSRLSLHSRIPERDHAELGLRRPDDPANVAAPGNFGGQVRTNPLYVQAARAVTRIALRHPDVTIHNTSEGIRLPGTVAARASEIELPADGVPPRSWLQGWRARRLAHRQVGTGTDAAPGREGLTERLGELARELRRVLDTEAGSRQEALGLLQEIHARRAAAGEDAEGRLAAAMLRGSVRHFSLVLAKALTVRADEGEAVALFHELAHLFGSFLAGVAEEAGRPSFWALDESRRDLRRRMAAAGGARSGAD